MTDSEKHDVDVYFRVYQNNGSVGTGRWVYQPHDFDSAFELWSDSFATEEEAYLAALAELDRGDSSFDWEAAKAAGPFAGEGQAT